MKVERDYVCIYVDFSDAKIPIFRQARREIDNEIAKCGLSPLDEKLLNQAALDRYAMELTNKLISDVSEGLSEALDLADRSEMMPPDDERLTQERIDQAVEESWRTIWQDALTGNLGGLAFNIMIAAGTPISIAGTGATIYSDEPRPDA